MFKKFHWKVILLLVIYFLVTQSSFFAGALTSTPILFAFILNVFFSVFFGVIFLYIFSNENFFGIGREIQKNNSRREKMWLHRFRNFGKATVVILIGTLLGPLFAAITIRFILPKYRYRYFLTALVATMSAVLWLGIARGIISFTIPFFK